MDIPQPKALTLVQKSGLLLKIIKFLTWINVCLIMKTFHHQNTPMSINKEIAM